MSCWPYIRIVIVKLEVICSTERRNVITELYSKHSVNEVKLLYVNSLVKFVFLHSEQGSIISSDFTVLL